MPQDPANRLQMRSIPWSLWLVCGLFVVIGLLAGVMSGQWTWLVIATVGLLAIAFFTKITSLTADHDRGMVTFTNWTLLGGVQRREIPIPNIAQVALEEIAGDEGQVFRVALNLVSGEKLPLTGDYSGNKNARLASAKRLSDFLALRSGSPVSVVDDAKTIHEQTGQTVGIAWRVETLLSAVGSPILRWSTTAGGCADALVILSQINPGGGHLHWDGGPLAGVAKFAYKSLLSSYRFEVADVEAIDSVQPVPDLDPQLHGCYVAFATSTDAARRWLSPARVQTLAHWAEVHPTPHMQSEDTLILGAGLLLAGPSGLWLIFRGAAPDPARVAEVTDLGAALAAAEVAAPLLNAAESGD